ncbi:MAG: hypothetical protein J5I59_00525 [Saprospiraceae bacterium]|nr:hypothetical protein [Saprospiraceae bacterium]
MSIHSQTNNYLNWEASFLKEVGPENFEQLKFEIDGEFFIPLGFSNSSPVKGILPKAGEVITFGEIIDFRNGKNPKQALLESLNHDFSAPVIKVDTYTDIHLFDDIQLDILDATLLIDDEVFDVWNEYHLVKYKDEVNNINLLNANELKDIKTINYLTFDCRNKVAPFISKMAELFSSFNHERFNLFIRFSGQFIHEIIKVRAIKIAWFNLLAYNKVKSVPPIIQIELPVLSEYPGTVISHTTQLIAASMAQADRIVFESLGDATERRILRNAAHIVMIESHLGEQADPVSGSYFIEQVATSLAQKAFQK